MHLNPVRHEENYHFLLYKLLQERGENQSISHRKMPDYKDHCAFVDSKPYRGWWFIYDDEDAIVGAVYLTRLNEIGIGIFREYAGRGHGEWAVRQLIHVFGSNLLANVNPENAPSKALFEKLGGKIIQQTYQLP